MDQSYWSVSDLLADATKIPCHFKLDVPGLAHLRGDVSAQSQGQQALQTSSSSVKTTSTSGGGGEDEEAIISKGTRLELPYWLAEYLVLQDIIDVSLPRPYSQRVRNALNAGPKSVQLRSQANWWYAVGSRLGGLMDSAMIMDLLSSTYISRLPTIYTSAQHLSSSSHTAGSDALEIADGSSRSGASSSANGRGTDGGKAGFGTSVGMSAEMVDFVNGLEETEKLALNTALNSASAMRVYLAGRT